LEINLPEYAIRKGFLAQAKRQEEGNKLGKSEWDRLTLQCKRMIEISSESFVFIYSRNGIFILPANTIVACKESQDLFILNPQNIGQFYKNHFKCYVGDTRIISIESLKLPDPKIHSGVEIIGTLEG
jgi:hypothetical protein